MRLCINHPWPSRCALSELHQMHRLGWSYRAIVVLGFQSSKKGVLSRLPKEDRTLTWGLRHNLKSQEATRWRELQHT